MPPRDDSVRVSSLEITPPARRNAGQSTYDWLKDKHATDGAEGLWRIHDEVFDFSPFVKSHPGGSEWLAMTKGTDITAAFEVHHLSTIPEELKKKYFVKKATKKRNSPFTFNDDGFYRTLKREVMATIRTLPKQPVNTTAFFTDALLFFTVFFSVLAAVFWSYGLAVIAGIFLGLLTIAAHNWFHKKDNFRMLYFNLSLMQTKDWRVSHALSHHLHTNTIDDIEIYMNEPIFQFLPLAKSTFGRYGPWVYFPLAWCITFHGNFLKRIIHAIKGSTDLAMWYDFVPFLLPLTMYLLGGQGIAATLWMWTVVVIVGSFHFSLVGFNAGHHHPDIFHDGDTPRPLADYDWGIGQLDAIMDRTDITGSHFLVLTNFGDHALHHLFPTLDHGHLELLYPTFDRVCKQFSVKVRFTTQWELLKGFFLQVARTETNPNPPDLHDDKYKSIDSLSL